MGRLARVFEQRKNIFEKNCLINVFISISSQLILKILARCEIQLSLF